jgi:osmotically-inducible protein OsmY
MRKTIALGFAAFVLLGLLAGCATNRSAGDQLDDAAIVAEIKARMVADTDVAALNIDVDSLDGVVTLTGEVDDNEARLEAERIARTTPGVVRVISRIRVS